MKKEDNVSPEVLKQLLILDPESGNLTWKTRPEHFCKSPKFAAYWNRTYEGKPAFVTLSPLGYLVGVVLDNIFQAHRIVWAMHYGEWPNADIDHINHVKTDNRIANLRTVPQQENTKNRSMMTNNTSKVMGVAWNKQSEAWCARIGVNYKQVHLGLFSTLEEAVVARKAAEIKYGFHENHGQTSPQSAQG